VKLADRPEEGLDPDPAIMNLAAACQIIAAVTSNIACMIGVDKAFEALDFVREHREALGKMVEEMRRVIPE
jgi:hypothetical protein